MLRTSQGYVRRCYERFNGHPPLGVNATIERGKWNTEMWDGFNGHPPLGVNATRRRRKTQEILQNQRFNGHPPLGVNATQRVCRMPPRVPVPFQWAPTLGGECYAPRVRRLCGWLAFQWAPTLGGECYSIVYLITPPLCQGVNALLNISQRF